MSEDAPVLNSEAGPEGDTPKVLWDGAYDDLKQLARSRLRVSRDLTFLDTTGLVSEVYARLAHRHGLKFGNRAQFLAYCARVMRSIIIDLVRASAAGTEQKITLNTEIAESVALESEPLRIDDALNELAQVEPRLAQVVEMRYFGGYTEAEVAEALDINLRTVQRDWKRARVVLRMMLTSE